MAFFHFLSVGWGGGGGGIWVHTDSIYEWVGQLSLHKSLLAHQAGAYPGFRRVKHGASL